VTCFVREFSIGETKTNADGVREAQILTRVTAGTFIRTLAEDLASRTGSLAHLVELRRLASGPLSLERASKLESLVTSVSEGKPWAELDSFLPFHRALDGILPRFDISEPTAHKIFSGEVRTLAELVLPADIVDESIALYTHQRMVAIVRDADSATGTPRRIERGFPLRFADPI
jgi:tRNA pseudouridine55 synthase